MARRDEYDHLAPALARYAALAPEDPARQSLRDELVAGFLPIARHIALRYARRGEPLDDLQQVAALGLLYAMERFDPGRGRDFARYAIPTITGEVRRYFRDAAWTVRAPRDIKDRYVTVNAATARLSVSLGHAPTAAELAAHLGLSVDEILETLAAVGSYRPTSLDKALTSGEPGAVALIDTLVTAEPDLDAAETRVWLNTLVGRLPKRERRILALRFVYDWTQSEIAAEIGISQMHVSRLLARSLELLRAHLHPDGRAGAGRRDDGAVHHAC